MSDSKSPEISPPGPGPITDGKATGKEKDRQRVPVHTRVLSDGTRLEAVHLEGRPSLLIRAVADGTLSFHPEYEHRGVLYVPPEDDEVGYLHYDFKATDDVSKCPNINGIIRDLIAEWKTFIDTRNSKILVDVAFHLLSYQREKLLTTPYRGYFGDQETGKGQRLELHHRFDYRAFLGTNIPAADLYYIIDVTHGVLIDDEVDRLDKDIDLLKLWKSGYKNGVKVPRLVDSPSGAKKQRFFDIFGPKVMASNYVQSKVTNRMLVEMTDYGSPKKDEFTNEDFLRFADIHKRLVLWSLHTTDVPLPDLETPLKSRMKELAKPLLQVANGTIIYDMLKRVIEGDAAQKTLEDQNSLQALLTKVCLSRMAADGTVSSEELREGIAVLTAGEQVKDANGIVKAVETEGHGTITNRTIASLMKVLFNGKPRRFEKSEKGGTVKEFRRGWKVDPQKVVKEARKFKLNELSEFKPLVEAASTVRTLDDTFDIDIESLGAAVPPSMSVLSIEAVPPGVPPAVKPEEGQISTTEGSPNKDTERAWKSTEPTEPTEPPERTQEPTEPTDWDILFTKGNRTAKSPQPEET